MKALTILNRTGDKTIVWDEQDDEQMLAFIQRKMDQGCAFFLIEPRLGGMATPTRTPLARASDAAIKRAVSVSDEDFLKVFNDTATTDVVKTPAKPVKTLRKAKTAQEVIDGKESVGVQQMQGG